MTQTANSQKNVLGLILLVLVLCSMQTLHAQSGSDSAQIYAQRAIDLMDQNQAEAAIRSWERAVALDPNNLPYKYEFALAYVMARQYSNAVALLEPIYKDPQLLDRGYQLLGNAYDLQNDSSKSLPYYREGLAAHPNSGRLHYELGAAALIDGNPVAALDWWTKGTRVEPKFATNYYWLARTYSGTRDKIWGVLFAEAFLNLERNTERTREISKLAFDTWNASMALGDTSDPINFASDSLLELPSPKGPNVMSFPVAFEYTAATSGAPLATGDAVIKRLTVAQLVDLRMRMTRAWEKAGYAAMYPNSVMDWNIKYLKTGWLKEYYWWLYSYGDKVEMNQYFKANEDRYDTFLGWFGQNSPSFSEPLCIDLKCQ